MNSGLIAMMMAIFLLAACTETDMTGPAEEISPEVRTERCSTWPVMKVAAVHTEHTASMSSLRSEFDGSKIHREPLLRLRYEPDV